MKAMPNWRNDHATYLFLGLQLETSAGQVDLDQIYLIYGVFQLH